MKTILEPAIEWMKRNKDNLEASFAYNNWDGENDTIMRYFRSLKKISPTIDLYVELGNSKDIYSDTLIVIYNERKLTKRQARILLLTLASGHPDEFNSSYDRSDGRVKLRLWWD